MEITDAYCHCGISKYKPVEELRPVMDRHGVRRAVLAQHRGEFNHSYIESVVRSDPARFTGVFLVDMDSPKAMDEVARWAKKKEFRGLRIAAATLRTHRPLWDWAATLGLRFIADGPQGPHAAFLDQFLRDHRRSTVVLCHLGQPLKAEAPDYATTRPLLKLAQHPNVRIQVSAMHQTGTAPDYPDLKPWVQLAFSAFGPDRLMYSSNFPVMEREEVYAREIELIRSGQLGIPAAAAEKVLNSNAQILWFSSQAL